MAKTNDPNRYRPGTRGHADALARQAAEALTASAKPRKTVQDRMDEKADLARRVRPLVTHTFGEQPMTARDRLALIASGLEPEGLPQPTGWITLGSPDG